MAYYEELRLTKEVKRLRRKLCCAVNTEVGKTDGAPVEAPGPGESVFLFDSNTKIFYYYNGVSWVVVDTQI